MEYKEIKKNLSEFKLNNLQNEDKSILTDDYNK